MFAQLRRGFPAMAPVLNLIIATLFLWLATTARAAEPQRWALLVGVGDNVNPSNVLRGPANDVSAMADLLCGRYGYSRDHLRILLDAKSTRAGILAGWDWLAQRVRPGDQVVFYYSGHGIDVPDPTKASGRDSAICPYDAVNVSGLITGREIGARIDRLPTDQIVAIVDACCSATATRDIRTRRRSPDPSTFGLAPVSHAHPDEAAASGAASAPLFAPTPNDHAQKERYIGAARIDQSAHECAFLGDESSAAGGSTPRSPGHDANPNMGALTFFLLKELRADPEGRLSYEDLTLRVRGDLAALFTDDPQEPQVSGPRLGVPFLTLTDSVATTRLPAPLPVAAARSAGGVGATVSLRALAGASLAPGSVLQGTGGKKWNETSDSPNSPTRDPAESGVLVRVISVEGATATGKVLAGSVYDGAPLIELIRPEPDGSLRVAINGTGGVADRLRHAAAGISGVIVVDPTKSSDVTLYPSANAGLVDLYRRGVALSPIPESAIPATLSDMRNVKRLADLQSDPNSGVHVTIQTLDARAGYSEAKVGATIGYQIVVDRDAYLTIVDIAADGGITGVTIPQRQAAGTPFVLPASLVTPPSGLDTVKVIATLFPVHFDLPASNSERESLGAQGLPAVVARRVVSVIGAQATAALVSEGHGADLGRLAGSDNGALVTAGWGTADMLLRVDP